MDHIRKFDGCSKNTDLGTAKCENFRVGVLPFAATLAELSRSLFTPMCIYTYIHTSIHAYMHTYSYIHTHTYNMTHETVCMCIYIYIYI